MSAAIEAQSRIYIKAIAGIECGEVIRQNNKSITLAYNPNARGTGFFDIARRITKALGVRGEAYNDHKGYQATWDFKGHRIALVDRFDSGHITLMPDPNVK